MCNSTVLVIDDEESMCEGCRQTLETNGYKTKVAENGTQGLQLVAEVKPNVVLLDLKMPGMSGIEVLERIGEIEHQAVTIVITGYGSAESAVNAMKLGAFDYLSKPFGDEQLVDAVVRGLEQYRLGRSSGVLEHQEEIARDNFAAVVCHQIKSPVASVAHCIEVMTRELLGPINPKQKSKLDWAYQRLDDLSNLITDWVKLAQVEAGAMEFKPEIVELAPVIKEAWNTVPDEVGRARIDLKLKVEENSGTVCGNAHLLQELFANLFTNSIKFTSGPGKVTVDVAAEGPSAVISVSDTGMGILEEELPHLFKPFYRGSRAGVKRAGGTGLGLSIIKKIVSLHGGSISVKSELGQGATFVLRLPTAPGLSTAPAIKRAVKEPSIKVAPKAMGTKEFSAFVNGMIADQAVTGVKAKEGEEKRFVFGNIEKASDLRLDYDVTLLPPKKYLLPPRETLVKFKLGNSPKAEPHIEAPQPSVLIGVHPYDMIALNQLDRLMSEGSPDPNYLARRAAFTVIGLDPARASEKAFWGAMGCDCVENGFDLWLTDIGNTYIIEVGSDRGASLLEKYGEARDATAKELKARAEVREKLRKMGAAVDVKFRPGELPALLRRSFDSGVWEENARKCLSCGSCNLVCPTCYCFDVKDDVDISLDKGERYRVWDGCVLQDFAKVGTGENFREERLQRYRHRFYRKGMYLYDKYGHIACVGCGRCVAACLSDIADPVTVYNTLKEAEEK